MHDFGLNLQKLIDIRPKKNTNILVEGTFGLYDKEQSKVIKSAYDYKQLLDRAREIISCDEREGIWPKHTSSYEGEKVEFWKLHQFLRDYELVFHEYTPIAWQQKHRLEFANELYNGYFVSKFDAILRQECRNPKIHNAHYLFSELIRFKSLKNRITLKKFPVLCHIYSVDKSNNTQEIIDYLIDQLEQDEFTLDVRTEDHKIVISLALKYRETINYIGLTVFENWKVDTKVDFNPLIKYMDEVENYIETEYLI